MALQPCEITGTVHDVNGEPVAGVKVIVTKVLKSGATVQYKQRTVAISEDDGLVTFNLPRSSNAWIEGKFFVGSTNFSVRNGVVRSIPNTATATLESLGDAVTLPVSSRVVREEPTGLVDGSNATFTLANTPVAGSEEVYLNGLLLNEGVDYTISGNTITMITIPETGDYLRVSYVI